MQAQASGPLEDFVQRFWDYLPSVAGGLLVLAIGLAAGWVVKRAVIRILIWLRLDRLAGRIGWRAALGKGDVREGLYSLLGYIAMFLVILVFLVNALQILGLTVLSEMTDRLVFYLPNLAVVGVILAVGVTVSRTVASRVQAVLEEEELAHAGLVAFIVKSIVLFVVGALVLWQLNFARQIVLSAFLIAFGAAGVAFAMAVGLGSAKAIQGAWEKLLEKRKQK